MVLNLILHPAACRLPLLLIMLSAAAVSKVAITGSVTADSLLKNALGSVRFPHCGPRAQHMFPFGIGLLVGSHQS